jgi:outer membrane protein
MKKILVLLCICFILPAYAQAAEVNKIGIIDLQKVLNECEAGKKAKTDLEDLIKSKESVIEKKGKEIEKLKNDMQKQASVLSTEAKKSKEDELEKLLRDYQRTVQDSQAEVKRKEGELTEAIIKGVHDIVDRIGKEEGYTIIIEKSLVLFTNQDLDITDSVIKEYNKSKK